MLVDNACGRCATLQYLLTIGSIHDIESYLGVDNTSSFNVHIFLAHWGHLAMILVWVNSNLFHISWNGNYGLWVFNPISTLSILHGIWDLHFCATGFDVTSHYTIVASSGSYNWLYSAGLNSVTMVYNLIVVCELLAVTSVTFGKVHLILTNHLCTWLVINNGSFDPIDPEDEILGGVSIQSSTFVSVYLSNAGIRLNCHIGVVIGFFSVSWCGHLVDVAIPISRGAVIVDTFKDPRFLAFRSVVGVTESGVTGVLASDNNNHMFRSTVGAGEAILTLLGGFKSNTTSLYLTDIAHHHLGVGVVFVWVSHLYCSLYKGLGHRIGDVLVGSNQGLIPFIAYLITSVQLQLSLGLGGLSLIASVIAQQMYWLTPYLYLEYDYIRTVALYVHHCWIASLLMMGGFGHNTLFLIRDCTTDCISLRCVLFKMSQHRGGVVSHLSWICLWLGFHTLGLYIHNDTAFAFCEMDSQILIEP